MSEIQNKSIFGEYDSLENRITSAFLHLLSAGGENIIRNIFECKGVNLPENNIIISTQESKGPVVADGVLHCKFSFEILIECKIGSAINKEQLDNYKEVCKQRSSQLLYLISDNTINADLLNGVPFFTWTELDSILQDYLVENDGVIGEVERYLIGQFKLMLENNNLIDKAKNRVIIVGGAFGEEIAKKYKFYACQNGRYFKKAEYLAFYHKKAISSLFRIEKGYPQNDMNLKDETLGIPREYFENYEPYYDESDRREVFKLSKEISDFNNVKHEVYNRKFYPYVRKQKYVSYSSIKEAKTTAELENWN